MLTPLPIHLRPSSVRKEIKRPLQIGFFVGDNNEIKFLNDVELNEVKSLNQKPQYVYSFEVLDSSISKN